MPGGSGEWARLRARHPHRRIDGSKVQAGDELNVESRPFHISGTGFPWGSANSPRSRGPQPRVGQGPRGVLFWSRRAQGSEQQYWGPWSLHFFQEKNKRKQKQQPKSPI